MKIGRCSVRLAGWLAAALLAVAASAQVPAPPVRQNVDGNGVDVVLGTFNTSATDISIGPSSPHGLAYTRYWSGDGWRDSSVASISGSTILTTGTVMVSIGGSSDSFTASSSGFSSDQGNGAALVYESSTQDYVYTTSDGTIVRFGSSGGGRYVRVYANLGWAKSITYTDGTIWAFTYKTVSYCVAYSRGRCSSTANASRLQSLTDNFGYQLKFAYVSNSLVSTPDLDNWSKQSRITAINNAVDYCDPTADSCSTPTSWPHADYVYTGNDLTSVADAVGRAWSYGYGGGALTAIRRPSATSDDVAIAYSGGMVSSVTRAGNVWTYNFATSGSSRTTTASVTVGSAALTRTVVSDLTTNLIASDQNENGNTTSYSYDGSGRVLTVTRPESDKTEYVYDLRGNATATISHPKGETAHTVGTASSVDLAAYASYPPGCTGTGITAQNCNKPTTSTDVAGNITNYYWNADGSPDYVEAPAPTSSGVRPRTTYAYTSGTASTKTASGSFAAGAAVTLPWKTWSCKSTSACAETSADSIKTVIAYQGGSSSLGSNLLATSSTSGTGDGTTLAATTSYGYDAIGNVTSVTDPLGHVSKAGYNAARQVVGTWTPAPDGSRRPRAVVTHYLGDGQPDSITRGTVNPDGSAFTELQYLYIGYDGYGRKVTERINFTPNGAATAAFALTQYSYDTAGRLQCTAVRMTSSTYGSLPSDACTQTGAGTDRITKTVYDAGRTSAVYSGVGTGLERAEVRYTYDTNGQVTSVADAKATVPDPASHVTSYAYDGFGRPIRTCYNTWVATCTSGAPSDFVQLDYGTGGSGKGRVVHRSIRGLGASNYIAYGYDGLGRVVSIDYPGTYFIDSDVTLAYDLLGRMLSATDTNGHAATFGYDALGRATSQGDALSGKTMTYDLAGRRTQLQWSDGFYVTYEYDATDAMTAIKENGWFSLATFGYDDLGRRTSLVRGNGVVTSYGYDGGSRLTSQGMAFPDTANNQSLGFAYNQAGQIVQRSASNDLYAWTQHYNVSRDYSANGLNQYDAIASGGATLTPVYDVKGNLASTGGPTYYYDTKNELVATSATGKQFYYDPLGRLDGILLSNGAPLAGLQYDGDHIADEVAPQPPYTIVRRYVWGPDADEPLVWYEGAGTGDRRWLVADERGSIVAVTNDAGTPSAINSYDEYGIPASTNLGRFQYTGQAWIPELGIYYYKARMYSPTLGRFMQTDPIGYGDGVNWYNYVHGDPVNGKDPNGLTTGTNVPGPDGLCGSCAGSVTWYNLPEGLKAERERESKGGSGGDSAGGGYTNGTRLTLTYPDGHVEYGPVVPNFASWAPNNGSAGGAAGAIGGGAGTQNGNDDSFCAANPRTCITVVASSPIPRGSYRALLPSDLGPNVNVVSLEGEIGIIGKNLNITVNFIKGSGHVTIQGMRTAVNTARSLGLSYVNFTGVIANDQYHTLFYPDSLLLRMYPGTEIRVNQAFTTITIPVPR